MAGYPSVEAQLKADSERIDDRIEYLQKQRDEHQATVDRIQGDLDDALAYKADLLSTLDRLYG